MFMRAIEILTAPVLIAQFGAALIALLWAFLSVEGPTAVILKAISSAALK